MPAQVRAGTRNPAQPGPCVIRQLHLGDGRPLDRDIPLAECHCPLGTREHDFELSRVEQQGHHVSSLPAVARAHPADLLTGQQRSATPVDACTVRDWFGDPARAGSPGRPGDTPPCRPGARRRRRRRPIGCRAGRGSARSIGARLRPSARARRRRARRRADGIRSPWRDHVLAKGVRPADDPVPRSLPLLHLRRHSRSAAQDAQARVHVARAGARGRRQGQALGCKEALLTLGDRPEDRWPEARAWLDEHGFTSTLDYVGHIARLITAETGMLAHLNPGVMSAEELRMLRPTAPSMGMMLETTSRKLFEEPGQVHYGSPDKDPALRLSVIEDAGRERVPFTTGILVGIGETLARPRRVAHRAARCPRPARAHPRGHRAELPREAPDGDAGCSGCRAARIRRRGRRRATGDGRGHADPGSAESLGSGRVRPAGARGRRRLGRGVAADGGSRESRAPLAASRRPRRRARPSSASSCASG